MDNEKRLNYNKDIFTTQKKIIINFCLIPLFLIVFNNKIGFIAIDNQPIKNHQFMDTYVISLYFCCYFSKFEL